MTEKKPAILLVDDEKAALEALRTRISWQALGVGQVMTACDAPAARGLCSRSRPDILVCDIEMPGESGLALMRWAQVHLPDAVCLLLTCHADFGYAKQAVELGAFEYLLKPAPIPELERALKRALEEWKRRGEVRRQGQRWDENRTIVLEQFWVQLLTGRIPGRGEELADCAARRGLELPLDKPLRPVLCSVRRLEGARPVFQEVELDFAFTNVLAELFAYRGKTPLVLADSPSRKVILADGDAPGLFLGRACSRFFELLEQHFSAEGQFTLGKPCMPEELAREYPELLERERAEKNGGEEITALPVCPQEEAPRRQGGGSAVIGQVRQYIREHLREDLPRDRLAAAVYVNPNYLSRLFREQTGIALVDYVTGEKIKEIQRLLRVTDRSVTDIALEYGYTNMPYFSKVFKKKTGRTPVEYRREGGAQKAAALTGIT